MPMKCTEKGSSAVVGQLLTREQVNSYNAMIRKVVQEKQHIFMEDYMAGVIGITYDEFDDSEYDTDTCYSRDLSDADSHPETSDDEYSHDDDDDDDDDSYDSDDDDSYDDDDTHDDDSDEDEDKLKFDDNDETETVASEESFDNDVGELGRLEDFAADVARFTADALNPGTTVSVAGNSEAVGNHDDPPANAKASKSRNATITFAAEVVTQEIAPPPIPFEDRNPVKNLMEMAGGSEEELFVPTASVTDYFVEHSPEQIEEYDNRLTAAVRHNDLDEIRRMHEEEGHLLQVSNEYGETVLHMACRRGSLDVVQYMVEEGGVSIRVRDDYGRTPLHDTCWTPDPPLELMAYLVNLEPDMLFMTDSYGFSPLDYARHQHRTIWNQFLNDHRGVISLAVWRKRKVELGTVEKFFHSPDASFPMAFNLNFEDEQVVAIDKEPKEKA